MLAWWWLVSSGYILVQFTCTVPIGRVRRSHLHSVKWCDGVNWVRCEIVGSRFGGTVISTALVRSVLWPSTWNVMWAQNQHVAELASGHTYWATIAIVVGQSPNRLHLVILVTLTGQRSGWWTSQQSELSTFIVPSILWRFSAKAFKQALRYRIWDLGLGSKTRYNGKIWAFWTKSGLFWDHFGTFLGLFVVILMILPQNNTED